MNCCNDKIRDSLLKEFQWYSNDFEDSPDALALKKQYLDTALSIVEEYLGYPLGRMRHYETHTGISGNNVYTDAFPIIECYSMTLNGKPVLPLYITTMGDYLRVKFNEDHKSISFRDTDVIEIDYTSGYDVLPVIVKQTIFRIATLLKTEAGGNIGITSKSYADNSRSFLNFTSFEKYLSPLSRMRRGLLN